MCRHNVQRRSACGNHSGLIVKAIPAVAKTRSLSGPESLSLSARNAVHLRSGTFFTFAPESRSPCPGIRNPDQSSQFRVPESPATGDASPIAEHQDKACAWLRGCLYLYLDQGLLLGTHPSEVTPQAAEDHSALSAVLHLRQSARSKLLHNLLDLFRTSSSCHTASLSGVQAPNQDGFL